MKTITPGHHRMNRGLVKCIVTYQNKPLTKRWYDRHPEIHSHYPSPDDYISKLYRPILEKATAENAEYLIEVSEYAVRVNGIIWKRD